MLNEDNIKKIIDFAKENKINAVYIGADPEDIGVDPEELRDFLFFYIKNYRYNRQLEDKVSELDIEIGDLTMILTPFSPELAKEYKGLKRVIYGVK